MTATTAPEAALTVLPKADGSAKYSYGGYTVTASVTGPIEAQRRDEHPYEALVDVIVRPAAGAGGESLGALPTKVATAHSIFVYRHPRAASGIHPAVHSLSTHPRQELSALSHPDRPPDRGNPRERLCKHKACSSQLGASPASVTSSFLTFRRIFQSSLHCSRRPFSRFCLHHCP